MADAVQIKLVLENEQLTKQLRDTERKFARMEAKAKQSANGMSEAFVGAAKGIAAAFLSVEAIKGFANAIISTSKAVADLKDQADQVGISFKAFQELQYAAIQSGTTIEKLTAVIAKMQVALGRMAETGKDDPLEKIGLSIEKIINLSPDKQFSAIIEALSKIENPAQRAAVAAELFGKGFKDINPIIEQGADGLAKTSEELRKMGGTISDVTEGEMAKFDDALETLKILLQASRAEGFAPLVAYLNGEFESATEEGVNNTNALASALGGLSIAIIGVSEEAKRLNSLELTGTGFLQKLATLSPVANFAGLVFQMKKASVQADELRAKSKIDWTNFVPPPAPVAVGDAAGEAEAKKSADAAAKAFQSAREAAAKEAARIEEQWKNTYKNITQDAQDAASKLAAFDKGGEEGLEALQRELDLRNAIAKASEGITDPARLAIIQEQVTLSEEYNNTLEDRIELSKTEAKAFADATEEAARIWDDFMTKRAADAEKTQEMWGNIGSIIGDAMGSIVTKAQTAEEAVRGLLELLIQAIVKAAILSAFNGGSFGANLGGIFGGPGVQSQSGGPTIRIYNQGGGLVKTSRRSNGDTDVIIQQLATAISKGGNQFTRSMERAYSLQRRGV